MEMGNNKKRKLTKEEKTPKISYALSRSIIEHQQQKRTPLTLVPKQENPINQKKNKKTKTKDTLTTNSNEQPIISLDNQNETEETFQIYEFRKEQGGVDRNSSESPLSSQINIPSTVQSESIPFKFGTTQVGVLLYTSQSNVLHISGMCTLKLISGKGNINGFRLKLNEEISIQSPPWTPAIRLFFESSSPSSSPSSSHSNNARFVNEIIQTRPHLSQHQQLLTNKLHSSMGVVEIISVDLESQNWMIRCEDYSKYQTKMSPNPSLTFLSTAVIGSSADLSRHGLDCQILPTDWVIAGDLFCKSIKSSPKTVLLGAKGVGKSTALRYLINRVLSKASYVAVLDCDVGQPEFTPSGLISLHLLSAKHPMLCTNPSSFLPLLSPPHLHLHKPDLSFYLGDLSMKNLPEIFESCVSALYSKYLLYAEYYRITGRVPLEAEVSEESLREHSNTSNFHLLSHESDDIQFPLPLIVNTDGMVRGLGVEIQRTILNLINPTHIFHIQTEKDKVLTPVEDMKRRDVENKLQINVLTPGRMTASRLSAQDLRDIRLVSYFLYESSYLNDSCRHTSSTQPVSIRNGVCVDYSGHLPTALLHSLEYSLPISKSCFHLIGSTIPARLLLAAFNVSIVGITRSSSLSSSPSSSSSPFPPYRVTHLQIPTDVMITRTTPPSSSSSSPTSSNDSRTTNSFVLNYQMNETLVHLLPCHGLGIVSDVDLFHSILHLISPSSSSALSDLNTRPSTVPVVHLTRGALQLPTSLMYNISGQVCAPYLCSESFGEGSTTLYARTNIKRRSHGK